MPALARVVCRPAPPRPAPPRPRAVRTPFVTRSGLPRLPRYHFVPSASKGGEDATSASAKVLERNPNSAPPEPPSNVAGDQAAGSEGSVLGATLLVAGTTVGAGILALPEVTRASGFLASGTALLGCFAFAVATGLLVAEVNMAIVGREGPGRSVSIITMAEQTLGQAGGRATSAAFLFLQYALIVAYISRAGGIVAEATGLPLLPSSAAFTLALGGLCYLTSTQRIESINGGLVAALLLSFGALLATTAPTADASALLQAHWAEVPAALPVMALAFVYHNVVPVVVSSLGSDPAKVRTAIIGGAAIPLAMFLLWDAAVLASYSALISDGGVAAATADPLLALQRASPVAGPLVQAFSFLAISTSCIGFVLGLTDFVADAAKCRPKEPLPYAATLLPPFVFAAANPDAFLGALDAAGTYGVMTIWGIVPAAMAWRVRYGAALGPGRSSRGGGGGAEAIAAATASSESSSGGVVSPQPPLVPGGRASLLLIAASSAGVIASHAFQAE